MSDCPFCQIVAGTIPAWVIRRDSKVICFLPEDLETLGHTVIAPIAHFTDIYAADEDTLGALFSTAKALALHYREQIGATGINLLHASGSAAQQSVGHFHLHLIPRREGDGLDAWPAFPGTALDKDELLGKLRFLPSTD